MTVFDPDSSYDRDCSIALVRGSGMYVYGNYTLPIASFSGADLPRRFLLSAVRSRNGTTVPRGHYDIYREVVEQALSDGARTTTATRFHEIGNLGLVIVPPDHYAARQSEPLVFLCAGDECSVSYRLDEHLHLQYWFHKERFAQGDWIALDQRMRKVAQGLRRN